MIKKSFQSFFYFVGPTTNGGTQNGSRVGICTRWVHVFALLASICMLSRCLLNRISASEISPKFIKSALLVGGKETVAERWRRGSKIMHGGMEKERDGGRNKRAPIHMEEE